MNIRFSGAAVALIFLVFASFGAMAEPSGQASVERGRYLIQITGCNDCHTAAYSAAGGTLPESEWLMGDKLGWKGPWGTTYSPNLRLLLSRMTEQQWVAFAHNLRSRPPMPSLSLNLMTEEDLQSIYRFVRGLQPLGEPAPNYVPPDVEPKPPYVVFPKPPEGD